MASTYQTFSFWLFLPFYWLEFVTCRPCLPGPWPRRYFFRCYCSAPLPCTRVCFGHIGMHAHKEVQWAIQFLFYLLLRCAALFMKWCKKRRKWGSFAGQAHLHFFANAKRPLPGLEKNILPVVLVFAFPHSRKQSLFLTFSTLFGLHVQIVFAFADSGKQGLKVIWCMNEETCEGKCLFRKEIVHLSSLCIWPFLFIDCFVLLCGPDGMFCVHCVLKLTLCLSCDQIDSKTLVGQDGVICSRAAKY